MKRWFGGLVISLLLLSGPVLQAKAVIPGASTPQARESLTLAVLDYRSDSRMQDQYAPLVSYLSDRTGIDIELAVHDQEALNRAIATNQVDLFLTNPSHFLLIRSERSLTGVLATLLRDWQGQSTSSIGGLIFTRADRDDLEQLEDLRGASIATPGIHFMGGYQAPALELKTVGIDVRRSSKVLYLGNHDRVIRAVVNGDTDVGFIRSGVLEDRIAQTPELASKLKVINPQNLTGYPFQVSTRLYPEWPLVSLPHVDGRQVRRIASALFALEPEHPAARAAGLAGFSPPADYQSVEHLARTLRVAPYDEAPKISTGCGSLPCPCCLYCWCLPVSGWAVSAGNWPVRSVASGNWSPTGHSPC